MKRHDLYACGMPKHGCCCNPHPMPQGPPATPYGDRMIRAGWIAVFVTMALGAIILLLAR